MPSLPAQSAASAPAIALPDPSAGLPIPAHDDGASFSPSAAEANRAAAVQKAAQQVANAYVIGDQTFSLYKDQTGQYITRFTSLRDGKVTYIPEPTLFDLGGHSESAKPVLNIKA